jgi:hypothetical protein
MEEEKEGTLQIPWGAAMYRRKAVVYHRDPSASAPPPGVATRAFWIFCALHLVVWTLVPSLMYTTVPQDTLEVIAWGNLWLPGYDKHPPLAAWLGAAASDLFGTVGWPVFLLSQASIILCFWAVWSLARSMLDPWRALIAVGLLEGVYYYNVASFTFNPNIVMLPTWAMLTLTAYRAILDPRIGKWAHAGLWAGLAFLAKYESALLFITLLMVLVITAEGRRCLRTPGPYLGIFVALLIATPNLLWLARHDFIAVQYAIADAQIGSARPSDAPRWSPGLFFIEQVGAALPAVTLAAMLRLRKRRFDRWDFNHVFIALVVSGPLLGAVAIGLLTGANMIARWGFPFFSLLGVALMLFFHPKITRRHLVRLAAGIGVLNVLLVFGVYWTIFVQPRIDGRPPYSIAFPGRLLAEQITATWRQRYGGRLPYVAGDRHLASDVSAYSPDRPVPFFDWKNAVNPWVDETRLVESGAVFVHRLKDEQADRELIATLHRRYPALSQDITLTLHQQSRAALKPVRVWVAWLPPAACSAPLTCVRSASSAQHT